MMVVATREQLLSEARGGQGVIIFGAGVVARTVIRFLMKNDIAIEGIADVLPEKRKMFGIVVQKLGEFAGREKEAVLLVCEKGKSGQEYLSRAEESGFERVSLVEDALYAELSVEENIHLDFVCAGFSKSGTTSLHTAFKKHPAIVLPKAKESYYMHWREKYDNAPERFREKYFPEITAGALVGDIEPSYHRIASEISECFGRDLKIILMMRNPIDATFSNFKMLMKNPTEIKQIFYFRKHNKYNVDMFDDYLRDYIYSGVDQRYQYSLYVQQFIDVFGRDKVKLVIFEELLSDITGGMNEIQEFLGVPIRKYKKFPRSNAGGKVSKNLFCMGINFLLYRKKLELKSASQEERKKFQEKYDKWHEKTLVENSDKMTEQSRGALRDFYRDSVQELSEIAGKDLGKFWRDF